MSPIVHLNCEEVYQLPATTNAVIVSGSTRTIYIGTQAPVDIDGVIVGLGDIAAQTTQVLRNLEAVLTSAGAKLEHVVKWNIYIVQGHPFGPAFEAFTEYWQGTLEKMPTTTILFVAGLAEPDFLIEIDAIAAVPE